MKKCGSVNRSAVRASDLISATIVDIVGGEKIVGKF
jgi:hypothetical protein